MVDQQCYSFTDTSIRDYLSTKRLRTTPSTKIEKCDKIKIEDINWTVIDITDFEKLESNAKAEHSPTLICPEFMGEDFCLAQFVRNILSLPQGKLKLPAIIAMNGC